MKSIRSIFLRVLLALAGVSAARAADPWPAESNGAAVKLTSIDSGLNVANWSGAFWNPDTRTLWLVCNNPGSFWALVEDGLGSFKVATNAAGEKAKWSPGGDLEGICQADLGAQAIFAMDENGFIREYDVSQFSATNQTHYWNIRAVCTNTVNSGGEGIAFVPDEYLRRQGFRDAGGNLYVSTNGMGGLTFVGYQQDGYVYAFDLNRALNTYGYVGRYKTGWAETADLEFDRAGGKLLIWHNTGSNFLEMVELRSIVDGADRRLRPLAEYVGPRTGNLEGLALVPSSATNDSGGCILTDDDNLNQEAVAWYRQFQPSDDIDADGLSDGLELWHFGSVTQTVGSADSDADRMSNAAEIAAGTDPTNSASALIQQVPAADAETLVLSWPGATGRSYAVQSTADLANGFTNVVRAEIPAHLPCNAATVDVSSLFDFTYYRIAVEAP